MHGGEQVKRRVAPLFDCFLLIAFFAYACEKKEAEDELDANQSSTSEIFPTNLSEVLNSTVPSSLLTPPTGARDSSSMFMTQSVVFGSGDLSLSTMTKEFDSVLADINSLSQSLTSDASCITSEVMTRNILAPDFIAFELGLQCYVNLSDSRFAFWGKDSAGNIDVYMRTSTTFGMAQIIPTGDQYDIHGYLAKVSLARSGSSHALVHFKTNVTEKSLQLTYTGPEEVCGLNLYANSDRILLSGSISLVDKVSCPAEEGLAFNASDFSAFSPYEGSWDFEDSLFLKRSSGAHTENGSSRAYAAYPGVSASSAIELEYSGNPNANGQDAEFGPLTANELIDREFK